MSLQVLFERGKSGIEVGQIAPDLRQAATEHDRLAPLETNTPGHDLVSADLEYALPFQNVSTTIYLQGRNLLDEKQRLSTSFLKDVAPQPGRSLFVGLRFDFSPPA